MVLSGPGEPAKPGTFDDKTHSSCLNSQLQSVTETAIPAMTAKMRGLPLLGSSAPPTFLPLSV